VLTGLSLFLFLIHAVTDLSLAYRQAPQ